MQKYTKEMFVEAAKQFTYSSEFKQAHPRLYAAANSRGWLKGFEWSGGNRSRLRLTYEECYEVAKQFTTLKDFRTAHRRILEKVRKNGWINDYTWLKRESNKPFTYDDCYNTAKKYEYSIDFKKAHPTMYHRACREGWLVDYTWFGDKHIKYTHDECRKLAEQFESLTEFRKKYPRWCDCASRNGWLEEFTWLRRTKSKKNTYEECVKTAQMYECSADFRKAHPSMFGAASRYGWLKGFTWKRSRKCDYTYEDCFNAAVEFDTIKAFKETKKALYACAGRHGWLKDYTWLRRLKPTEHTYDECYNIARQFDNLCDFSREYPNIYACAHKNGWRKDYTWLKTKQLPKLTYQDCYMAAKEVTCSKEFENKYPSHYNAARRNDWLKDYTWFNITRFSREFKLNYLKSGDLEKMSQHQLIELAMKKVIPPEFKVLAYANGNQEHLNTIIRSLINVYSSDHTDEENESEVQHIEQEERRLRETEVRREASDNGLLSLVVQSASDETSRESEQQQTYVLPSDSFSEFRMYDNLRNMKPGDKSGEFIVEEECSKLWNAMLYANEDGKAQEEYERIKAMECGEFSSYVRDKFVTEYEAVTSIKEDQDYRFDIDGEPCPLSLMQKLMAYKMSINDSYGNWCGTGAGKTNAFLFSTRYVGAKTSVVIVPNGVIDTLVKAIKRIYPNSNIVVPKTPDDIVPYSKDRYTYIIFNYEKFHYPQRAKDFINRLFDTNTIDFVCLDEAHNIKVRDAKTASNRSKYINSLLVTGREKNPDMKTLAMTATPCPNTLSEVRSIIEALIGKKYPEIGNRTGIDNVHNAYKALVVNGFRYVPKYPMVIKERVVEIDCTGDEELVEELRNRDINSNDIAYILAKRKLDVLKNELRDGTVVYSNWVDGMAGMLEENIRSWGYTVECYNGMSGGKDERKDLLEAFLNKKINVLVCSQPISTGVDGLQKRCNKMVFMSLPWTDVDYTQTKGRVYRQGSVFKEVEFVIPQVTITQRTGKVWSYDRGLYGVIETKRSLASAVLEGYIQDSYHFSHDRLKQLALEALEAGLDETEVEREDVEVDVDLTETEEQRKVRRENYVNGVHRLGNTSNHKTMHKYFSEHPDVFNNYHDSRDTDELAKKTVIPIADYINSHYTNKHIADLGCGVNMLSTLVKNGNTVTGFDHQRYKDHDEVVIADIADLSGLVKDREFDIAVFSLSLWAPDYEEYFNEAYRLLSKNGIVFVVEPVSKFGEGEKFGTEEEFVDMVENYGFSRLGGVKNHQGFKFFRFEKED